MEGDSKISAVVFKELRTWARCDGLGHAGGRHYRAAAREAYGIAIPVLAAR